MKARSTTSPDPSLPPLPLDVSIPHYAGEEDGESTEERAPHSDDDNADNSPYKRTKEDKKQPQDDDDDAIDSPDKRTKEDERQHLINWASECTLKDIVLT